VIYEANASPSAGAQPFIRPQRFTSTDPCRERCVCCCSRHSCNRDSADVHVMTPEEVSGPVCSRSSHLRGKMPAGRARVSDLAPSA
jgi:hypothetical protein